MKAMKYNNGRPVRQNGRFVYVKEKECVKQRLTNALKLWKREWFLHEGSAIDWHTLLQDKPTSDRRIRIEVEKVLSEDTEVNKVESIDITYVQAQRKMTLSFSVQTLYGEVGGTI